MTPDAVCRWLAEMQAAGRARTDADCARLLGLTPRRMSGWRTHGVTGDAARRTALACTALLHRMEPYG